MEEKEALKKLKSNKILYIVISILLSYGVYKTVPVEIVGNDSMICMEYKVKLLNDTIDIKEKF